MAAWSTSHGSVVMGVGRASRAANYITGQVLYVDGGLILGL